MDWSPPGSSVHGIFQARILEWVAISSCRRSFQPRDRTHISCVSCIAGRFFTSWAPGETTTSTFTCSLTWKLSEALHLRSRDVHEPETLLLQLASSLSFSLATSLQATFLRRRLSQPCHSCPVFAHSGDSPQSRTSLAWVLSIPVSSCPLPPLANLPPIWSSLASPHLPKYRVGWSCPPGIPWSHLMGDDPEGTRGYDKVWGFRVRN